MWPCASQSGSKSTETFGTATYSVREGRISSSQKRSRKSRVSLMGGDCRARGRQAEGRGGSDASDTVESVAMA